MAAKGNGARFIGSVKWFNSGPGKGFGFIICPEACKEDIFTCLQFIEGEGYKALSEGDRVSFRLDHDEQGRPQARDVRVEERALTEVPTDVPIGSIIRRNVKAEITIWKEEGYGFVANLPQFGGKSVFVHPSELDDESEDALLKQGTVIVFDVAVVILKDGSRGLQGINIKPHGVKHEVIECGVEAVVKKYDPGKRQGTLETLGEQPMRVFLSNVGSKLHEVSKNDQVVVDLCQGDKGPYAINARLDDEQHETAMAAAFKTANGKDNGDDPDAPSATELLHKANDSAKVERKKAGATA